MPIDSPCCPAWINNTLTHRNILQILLHPHVIYLMHYSCLKISDFIFIDNKNDDDFLLSHVSYTILTMLN